MTTRPAALILSRMAKPMVGKTGLMMLLLVEKPVGVWAIRVLVKIVRTASGKAGPPMETWRMMMETVEIVETMKTNNVSILIYFNFLI